MDQKFPALSYRVSITPVAGNRDFGLVFFAKDETDLFLFRINGSAGTMGVYRRSGGTETKIAEGPLPFTVLNGKTYGMKINARINENTVHFYFDEIAKFNKDGEFLAFAFDNRDAIFGCFSGYLGLWANLSTIKVDWVQNSAEPALGGWTINLAGPVGYSVVTEKDGSYCFVGLPFGSYEISETLIPSWTQTFPDAPGIHSVELTEDDPSESCINFGNKYTPSLRVRTKTKTKR
jgi:hypothetical protein